jgi:NIPSNAP
MQRRDFLAASLATSAAALARPSSAQTPADGKREFYQLRRYILQSGPQVALTDRYIGDALIPALACRGMGPIGAFHLDIGPQTPVTYVLIPSRSIDALVTLDLDLSRDEEFLKAADPFWNAPATAQAFVRVESSLLAAFTGWPRVTPPQPPLAHGKRIFQLRTYESPSFRDHVTKVEMFHSGEFAIFQAAGFQPIFFGDMLIGSRMPCLTYMLCMADLADMDAKWNAFRNDPNWKKLSADPRFAFDQIVTNITNLMLSPLDSSQI